MGQHAKRNNHSEHNKDKGNKNDETLSSPTFTTVVLKVDMHCDGCASKIVKCIHGFQGVESLKTEKETGKLTITGNVDPAKLKNKLADKMKKSVELISPLSKNKENENKSKNDNENKKPKVAPVTTVVLKVPLLCPCQGCHDKIRKMVLKTKGVHDVGVDKEKEMVMVKGTMDVKALVEKLSKKCKRKVEVVPPKKEKEEKEKKEKKEKEGEKDGDKGGNSNGAAKKKKKGGGGNGGGGGDGGDNDKGEEGESGGGGGDGQKKMEQSIVDYTVPGYGYCYGGCGNGHYYPVSQMFSDENPYACCIM